MGEFEIISISDIRPDDNNANKGSERGTYMLRRSLEKLGAGRSILLDKNGRIIAGNKTAETAADVGLDEVLLVRTKGNQLVAVMREDLDLDDPTGTARELAYADNRTGQVSLDWDAGIVLADLDAGVDLSDWFKPFEIDEMFGDAVDSGVEKGAKPNPRILPIDVIYTLQMADCTCCLAVQAGLKYGINSSHYRLCPYTYELSTRHEVAFIDNDYFNYDHSVHLEAVRQFKPKYATVRDVMTENQCEAAGIAYYSLEQILEWADELNRYAENVIIIPKYDCISDIPDRYMLGYSIPTSHGGTPLPVELFRGRRVHLLGGSWKAQMAYMAELGDDVVSLDNNYVQRQAGRLGIATSPEGDEWQLSELEHLNKGFERLTNPRYVALSISFGAIGSKINELYAGSAIPAE